MDFAKDASQNGVKITQQMSYKNDIFSQLFSDKDKSNQQFYVFLCSNKY